MLNYKQIRYFLILPLVGILIAVSGCGLIKPSSKLTDREKNLQNENDRLTAELAEREKVIASLQIKLLEKHGEVDRLNKMNEQLISEFVRNKSTLRNRGDKAETVRLIAEVETVLATTQDKELSDNNEKLLERAVKYLADSKNELEKGNVDGAFYLASQSLELVHEVKHINGTDDTDKNQAFITFAVPLQMKLIETSNVRSGPSIKEKVKFVIGAGETVSAIGYQGQWVNVNVDGKGNGWIHNSLLN